MTTCISERIKERAKELGLIVEERPDGKMLLTNPTGAPVIFNFQCEVRQTMPYEDKANIDLWRDFTNFACSSFWQGVFRDDKGNDIPYRMDDGNCEKWLPVWELWLRNHNQATEIAELKNRIIGLRERVHQLKSS